MNKQEIQAGSFLAHNTALRIGLIGAMDEEVELLKCSLTDRQDLQLAGYDFHTGKLHGVDVILLKSGIGKVNAAIGCTLLLQHFKPDCVINTGSAGGFDPNLNVGDIVICNAVCHHDVDVTAFGYAPGQVPGSPEVFLPHPDLAAIAEQCIANMDGIHTCHGLIATGDQFMHDPERVAKTREVFPNLAAVEMEAAAIAQTCYQFEVPFIIIRALSDIAGKSSNLSFEQFLHIAAKHSAEMIISMIEATGRG
ncbi:5'-methylthioadenosine/S-adenosylhomocysteine nucleosidase [Pontibacter sp. JAM-7]|uniref:5'-methylthioadenosine/S-adenosylhomocysteine nucleosidase n=1 Tax=Pontibacter sp. JAM-7 TaxID=3366581 RepID=UPI003AF4ED1D